jgi:hypothetical protein
LHRFTGIMPNLPTRVSGFLCVNLVPQTVQVKVLFI